VTRATLSVVVSAPGRTAALREQKLRTPFAGTLTELLVTDGDTVSRGQALGAIVSRDSEAALSGAQEMAREARSPVEKRDAERALALAKADLVRTALRASASGTVMSHAASRGDRLTEGQEILTLSDWGSIVFLADVPQSDLPGIHPGQSAAIALGGRPQAIHGVVYATLPAANAADFTAPVRIDLRGSSARLPAGLSGSARITVRQRPGVLAVPDAAILRDDVTGVSRVAVVEQGHARWIVVTTGLEEKGRTEVTSGNLMEGQEAIVEGQVGLPEGSPVVIQP
jgi:RND family efflux transporter MFP subunit